MKRFWIFLHLVILGSVFSAFADVDETFQFMDKDGNIIADGSELVCDKAETDDWGGVLVRTGLFVKSNATDDKVLAKVQCVIEEIPDNSSIQCCFPANCMMFNQGAGTYNNGPAAYGSSDFQTEWFPATDENFEYVEGQCKASFQLFACTKKTFGSGYNEKAGPIIHITFKYTGTPTPEEPEPPTPTSDQTFQFMDKDGNIIADGSELVCDKAETDDWGGVLVRTGLFVKSNATDDKVLAKVQCVIEEIPDNSSIQCCFPANCMMFNQGVGTYNNGPAAYGSSDFQTEWFPATDDDFNPIEGQCKASFQLFACTKKTFGSGYNEKAGPIVHLTFSYEEKQKEQTLDLLNLPNMTYGDDAYSLPTTTNEGLPLGWVIEDSSIAEIDDCILNIKKAGTTIITATQEGAENYLPFIRNYSLSINKAHLTITANSHTITVGEELPPFDVTYDGFVYSEDDNCLLQKPIATCNATRESPTGVYEIQVSGAESENYSFTYINGKLTIKTNDAIDFVDSNVKAICISHWDKDGDGELSKEEAAQIIDLENAFENNIAIRSFDELEYFTSLNIVGEKAFAGCESLTSVTFPDNVMSVSADAFSGSTSAIYAKRGSLSLLSLWKAGIITYDKISKEMLLRPELYAEATQTTISINVSPYYAEYSFYYDNFMEIPENGITLTGLFPECDRDICLTVALDGLEYKTTQTFSTLSLNLSIDAGEIITASSISFVGSYENGDAIVSDMLMCSANGETFEGNKMLLTGQKPDSEVYAKFIVNVLYGNNGEFSKSYMCEESIKTEPLICTTHSPKVLPDKDVVVSASLNVDNIETNVGFEWRRVDTDESLFDSNRGLAYIYEGTIEGCIHNLNENYLWKFRPYYQSNSGDFYYGVWKGIDLNDNSYFEPTVHTYADVDMDGDEVSLTGYVQRGSDDIDEEGFNYWENGTGSENVHLLTPSRISIPNNALTVTADGTLMQVRLSGLRPNTTYNYVAYMKTVNGDKYYGVIRSFTTGDFDVPTGVVISENNVSASEINNTTIFDLSGKKIGNKLEDIHKRGVRIIRLTDGTTRKVVVR